MNEERVRQIVQTMLSDFNSPPVATHFHNGWDANNLDPVIALMGFPVLQVTDASIAPTDQSDSGKFRFLVDFAGAVPHYYLWAYLVYQNATNVQVGKWVKVQLS